MPDYEFPNGFKWGAATSAFQIEGAASEDGKGVSVWDTYSHTEGLILTGETGDVAIDHYHRYREDVAHLKELGLQTYRCSLAWTRIIPEGTGDINQRGIDFYNRLFDELIDAGIEPIVTLYHWDLPQHLADKSGWLNRESSDWFLEYAETCFAAFGDRVENWITLNEPWEDCFALVYRQKKRTADALTHSVCRSYNQMLAHAKAVRVFRELVPDGKIGAALSLNPSYAVSERAEDQAAARCYDGFQNRWFLDPVMKGEFPRDMLELYQRELGQPVVEPGDLELIASQRSDFLGVNYYTRAVVQQDLEQEVLGFSFVQDRSQGNWSHFGEDYPQGLYDLLLQLDQDYDHPLIYITENGVSYGTEYMEDGRIRDNRRVVYFEEHLQATHRAIAAGVDVQRYYLWSCFDNFEWLNGFSQRLGLISVDPETQERIWKNSAFWYRDVIRNHGC